MKILIVEDDVNSRVFLARALLSKGYTVESAANKPKLFITMRQRQA